jgi:hypothetical protein
MSAEIKKFMNRSVGTDCFPYEVVRVVSPKCVEIREMKHKQTVYPQEFHVGGFAAHCADNHAQDYEYFSNESAEVFKVRYSEKRKAWGGKYGRFWMSDKPRYFYDYNF